MATALNRQPKEKTTLTRLAAAYAHGEKFLAELDAINLNTVPRRSPIREHVKAARTAANTALTETGSAIKVPRQTSVHG